MVPTSAAAGVQSLPTTDQNRISTPCLDKITFLKSLCVLIFAIQVPTYIHFASPLFLSLPLVLLLLTLTLFHQYSKNHGSVEVLKRVLIVYVGNFVASCVASWTVVGGRARLGMTHVYSFDALKWLMFQDLGYQKLRLAPHSPLASLAYALAGLAAVAFARHGLLNTHDSEWRAVICGVAVACGVADVLLCVAGVVANVVEVVLSWSLEVWKRCRRWRGQGVELSTEGTLRCEDKKATIDDSGKTEAGGAVEGQDIVMTELPTATATQGRPSTRRRG